MHAERSTEAAGGQQVSTQVSARGSALRAQMITQMTEKGLAEETQAAYVRGVLRLVEHYGRRKPEAISVSEARAYIESLSGLGVSDTLRSHASAGMRSRIARAATATVRPAGMRTRSSGWLASNGCSCQA